MVAGRGPHRAARQPDPHLGFARQPTHSPARSALPVGLSVRRRLSSGVGAGLVLPRANLHAMNLHLQEIATLVSPGAFAVLTLDGAGWHQAGDRLVVPDNIGLLHLPPYSPELNPVENVWEYLRANKLCGLVWDTYDTIVEACPS